VEILVKRQAFARNGQIGGLSRLGQSHDLLVLNPNMSRAYWRDSDMSLTKGEYKIVHLLVSNVGRYVTYRAIYDRLHYEGFIAGSGDDGYRGNVRSAIKRIRNKFPRPRSGLC
jgi:DNA-binding response OmpR family regulator